MQAGQTTASVAQALASLKSAQARLLVAEEQYRVQPELNTSDVAQAEANLRAAQQAAELLVKSSHPQALVEADTNVQDAEANEQVSRRNLERQRTLLDKGFVSEQVVDTARSQHAAALARLDQAKNRKALLSEQQRLQRADAASRVDQMKAALDRAKSGSSDVAVRKKQVEAARADVQQAQAQLDLAKAGAEQDHMKQDDVVASRAAVRQLQSQLSEVKVRQGDTSLVAPMTGTVTRRYMEEGELVTSAVSSFSSGTPVFQVGSLERMIVKMTVNEVDVYRVKKGLPVEIRVDGARGEVFKGRVRKVAPASQGAASGDSQSAATANAPMGVIRFSVEIEMVDQADAIRPGMSARCTIVMDRHKNVLRVPANCVTGTGADATVQVATEHKTGAKTDVTYETRKVKTGLRNESHVEILSGLKEGEKLKPGEFAGPKRAGIRLD
jgi:HlyD family secretion protein